MTILKPIKCGWKWLEKAVNDLIRSINERTISVSVGGGLDIQETPNGVLIGLSGTLPPPVGGATAAAKPGGGPTEGAWLTIDVMDTSCHRSTIQVWSRPV